MGTLRTPQNKLRTHSKFSEYPGTPKHYPFPYKQVPNFTLSKVKFKSQRVIFKLPRFPETLPVFVQTSTYLKKRTVMKSLRTFCLRKRLRKFSTPLKIDFMQSSFFFSPGPPCPNTSWPSNRKIFLSGCCWIKQKKQVRKSKDLKFSV